MPSSHSLSDEQRKAMFARLAGGGSVRNAPPVQADYGANDQFAAEQRERWFDGKPLGGYKPEGTPVLQWLGEFAKGFLYGANDGAENLVQALSLGFADELGITDTTDNTGFANELSKGLATLTALSAYAAGGLALAGGAGLTAGTGLTAKEGMEALQESQALENVSQFVHSIRPETTINDALGYLEMSQAYLSDYGLGLQHVDTPLALYPWAMGYGEPFGLDTAFLNLSEYLSDPEVYSDLASMPLDLATF